ncbi:MAG: GHKL domain-containing protein [Limnothrix sp. RL_2_0]|nr:GHKL domain-containing protein [Limnothrix sp. RL_2_0]
MSNPLHNFRQFLSRKNPLSQKFRLVRYFSATSFVAFTIAAGFLAWVSHRQARYDLEQFGRAANVELAQTLTNSTAQELATFVTAAQNISDRDLPRHPLTLELKRYLENHTDNLNILKIKIFDSNGRIIFSTDPKQIGQKKSGYRGFEVAIANQVFSSLQNHDPFLVLAVGPTANQTLYSSYVPLYPQQYPQLNSTQGTPIGVLEMYRDVTFLSQAIARSQREVFLSILLSFIVLYLVMLVVVNRAQLILRFQQTQLQERNKQIQEQADKLQITLHQLRTTQTQLIQQEKMSGLGRMVAGVSHELNNPITFVRGNIDHADRSMRDLIDLLHIYEKNYPIPTPEIQQKQEEVDLEFLTQDLPRCLQSMKKGTARIQDIILALRIFSRLDEAGIKAIDVNQNFMNIWSLLNYRLMALDICVIERFEELPQMECDAAGINQVLFHIINNAIDALEDSKQSDKQITICTKQVDDQMIAISIANNGEAIAEKDINYIFDPFFTTRSVGQGTGMGLTIAYQIVNKHRGEISVQSTDECTVFTVKLPIKSFYRSTTLGKAGIKESIAAMG